MQLEHGEASRCLRRGFRRCMLLARPDIRRVFWHRVGRADIPESTRLDAQIRGIGSPHPGIRVAGSEQRSVSIGKTSCIFGTSDGCDYVKSEPMRESDPALGIPGAIRAIGPAASPSPIAFSIGKLRGSRGAIAQIRRFLAARLHAMLDLGNPDPPLRAGGGDPMRIEQLMAKSPKSCQSGHTLSEAAQMMWNHDCGCLPVAAGDGSQRVVGT